MCWRVSTIRRAGCWGEREFSFPGEIDIDENHEIDFSNRSTSLALITRWLFSNPFPLKTPSSYPPPPIPPPPILVKDNFHHQCPSGQCFLLGKQKWRSIERLDAPSIWKCNVNVKVNVNVNVLQNKVKMQCPKENIFSCRRASLNRNTSIYRTLCTLYIVQTRIHMSKYLGLRGAVKS